MCIRHSSVREGESLGVAIEMLGYEWTNPFAISSPHPEEEPVPEEPRDPRHQIFPFYERSGFEPSGTLFSITPPPVSASPTAFEEDFPVRLYSLSQLPPAPVEPEVPAGPAMRIGLNLGVRTYFASSPDGELMRLGTNVYRRSGGSAGAGAGTVSASMVVAPVCKARCQAEGCAADLTRAKHYHRRHKVCEFHSKAAAVVAHGLTQRFCQQCSRFHVLSEFDQGKRSCRKRLADHNRRRRKTQPPPAPSPAMSPPPQHDYCSSPTATAITSPPIVNTAKPLVEGASLAGGATPGAAAAMVARPASPTRIALGRCFHTTKGVPGANCTSSSSSPSSCSSSRSSSSSVLPHLADFGSYYRPRVPMSIWDANADD